MWFINCYDFIFTWDTHAIPIWNMFLVHKVKTGSMVFLLRLVLKKLIQFYDYSCFSNILESHFFQKTRQVWIISLVDPWGLIHCTPQWTFSNEKIEIPGFLTFCYLLKIYIILYVITKNERNGFVYLKNMNFYHFVLSVGYFMKKVPLMYTLLVNTISHGSWGTLFQ